MIHRRKAARMKRRNRRSDLRHPRLPQYFNKYNQSIMPITWK
jgi:hypothetical protein